MQKFFLFFLILISNLSLCLDPSKKITQYFLDNWDREYGLPSTGIYDIKQGKNGYIWLATEGGLVRFDGVSFKIFNKNTNPEFETTYMRNIFVGKDNYLIISTIGGGALIYKNGKFKKITIKEGLSDNNVLFSFKDSKERYWFCTFRGLDCFDKDKIKHYNKKDGLSSNKIYSFYEDKNGNFYVSCEGGIFLFEDEKFKLIEEIKENYVYYFYEDKNDNLWAISSNGLYILKGKKFQLFDLPDEIIKAKVECILLDKNDIFWLGTRYNGLYKFYKDEIENLSKEEGLSDLWIRSLMEDNEGSLWIATNSGGLSRLKDTKFKTITKLEGLRDEKVWGILEDKNGGLWIRSVSGISYFYKGKAVDFTDAFPGSINSISIDKENNLWLYIYNYGFIISKNNKISRKYPLEELKNKVVYCMSFNKEGDLFLGTPAGLVYKFKNGRIELLEKSKEIQGIIRFFYEDKKGNFWIASDRGLFLYKNETLKKLFSEITYSVYEDKKGNLWIGTLINGLFLFEDGKFYQISVKDGLFDFSVSNILEDNSGNLWMSSNNGVFSSPIEDLKACASGKIRKIRCNVYGRADGMRIEECNSGQQPNATKSSDGLLYYPTMKGVVIIDPENLSKNNILPGIYIEELKVDENIFEGPFPSKFGPGIKRMEFKFTALSFLFPEKVFFKYKLEGYDQNWVDCANKREAFYTNLPPRKYKFKVIACNNDGLWNEDGASLSFTLLPFFYQTISFKIFLLFLLSGLVFAFVKYKINQVKKRSMELEVLVEKRTKELKEEKEKEEKLLLNILPQEIVFELKNKGYSHPKNFQSVSIMFTDFKGFTTISATLPPEELVKELNDIYSNFDIILKKYKLEKIRTLGDSYMVVSGLPTENKDHAINIIKAGLEMQEYLNERNKKEAIKWEMRVGIHSGQVTAGIIGKTKFTYDIWGDAVNIAARMEQASEAGKINISAFTYYLVKEKVEVEYRGKIDIKGKGEVDMYFVRSLK